MPRLLIFSSSEFRLVSVCLYPFCPYNEMDVYTILYFNGIQSSSNVTSGHEYAIHTRIHKAQAEICTTVIEYQRFTQMGEYFNQWCCYGVTNFDMKMLHC